MLPFPRTCSEWDIHELAPFHERNSGQAIHKSNLKTHYPYNSSYYDANLSNDNVRRFICCRSWDFAGN